MEKRSKEQGDGIFQISRSVPGAADPPKKGPVSRGTVSMQGAIFNDYGIFGWRAVLRWMPKKAPRRERRVRPGGGKR